MGLVITVAFVGFLSGVAVACIYCVRHRWDAWEWKSYCDEKRARERAED